MNTVGYLGPKGTFSEEAYYIYSKQFQDISDGKAGNSFYELFSWLNNGTCDKIIIPIENSVEGFVSSNQDLLVKYENIRIQNEITLPIRHCLMAKDIVPIEKITHIYSHPQPLAQCQEFIQATLPNAKTIPSESTAMAAEFVEVSPDDPTNRKVRAVIGGKKLALIYNLQILKSDINDLTNNKTRFLVLTKKEKVLQLPHNPSTPYKTSIVFSTKKDEPGSLVTVLEEFKANAINLSHISSRPNKTQLGAYLFFIDFDGHITDSKVASVIKKIEPNLLFYKFLGSYPKGDQ